MDQAELTPALERVAASVVETNRKRQQVEEELKAAAAAVASLHSQSSSLESSVQALRTELEQALRVKAQEDASLTSLADKQQAAADRLSAIAREVETFLADQQRLNAEITTQAQTTRARLQSIEGDVAALKTSLGGVTSEAALARQRLNETLERITATGAQIGDAESKTRELNAAVDGVAAKICAIADDLEQSDRERKKLMTTADELRAVSAALETRRAEAQSATQETQGLLAQRAKQSQLLSQQIDRLSQLTAGPGPVVAPAEGVRDGAVRIEAGATTAPEVGRSTQTADVIGLLAASGLLSREEAQPVLDQLADGDVDRFVRSLWSRAMGGPQPAPYRIIIGTALGESGDHKGAVTFFNKALEGRNVDPMATYLVALELLRMKRYVDVLRLSQALGHTKNGKTLSRNIEALHLAASGRPEEAEQKLAEALGMPGQPRSHYSETMHNLTVLARRRGDTTTAAMWQEKLTGADPTYRNIALHMQPAQVEAGPA